MDEKNNINSLVRAFSILEQFDLVNYELSITELRNKTSLPFSTLHRSLSTMKSMGYINQNAETGKYRLGYKLLVLGENVKVTNELKAIAEPHLKNLADKYSETVHLGVEIDGNVFCLERISAQDHQLSVTPNFGKATNIFASSLGKCLLAYKPDDILDQIIDTIRFEKLTPNTITDKAEFKKSLMKVRAQGYALDAEELEVGLTCVGAPIFDFSKKCIAAVSLSTPNYRLKVGIDVIKDDVIETARLISKKMGY